MPEAFWGWRKLSLGHRAVMALLRQSLRGTPFEKQTAENRTFMETYGGQADFTDFSALKPIIRQIKPTVENRIV